MYDLTMFFYTHHNIYRQYIDRKFRLGQLVEMESVNSRQEGGICVPPGRKVVFEYQLRACPFWR